jgi:HNH endonuclease
MASSLEVTTMTAAVPSSLSSDALARRLAELAGDERQVQVDFLLHLDAFDQRRAWLQAGCELLWTYCLRSLHLREGPAGRRISAMRVLRRFPMLEAPLRDGRLCLSTVSVLGPLLTPENVDDLVARAAFKTKAEVERLAAALQPRIPPKEGVRKLPDRGSAATAETPQSALILSAPGGSPAAGATLVPAPPVACGKAEPKLGGEPTPSARPSSLPRPEVRPVAEDLYSLRVTLDAATKAELDELTALLSHRISRGDLAGVLREAIHCALEKHGVRKGARAPARGKVLPAAAPKQEPSSPPAPSQRPRPARPSIPAAVRRVVWARDGGRCAWTSVEGHRCGSTWQLEFDHIRPVALGGESTVSNVRMACRMHNCLHAEQVFGREQMAAFTQGALIPG